MLFESSSIASVIPIMVTTLQENYLLDAQPLLERNGLGDYESLPSGARVSDASIDALWLDMVEATNDELVGIAVGKHARPTTFHALGFAWLASSSIADALARLCRYAEVIGTGASLEFSRVGDYYELQIREPDTVTPNPYALDAFFAAIVQMCKRLSNRSFAPIAVHFDHTDFGRAGDYTTAFEAPSLFDQPVAKMIFDKERVETLLPSRDSELARSNDAVVEAYLESLETKAAMAMIDSQRLDRKQLGFVLGSSDS